ncbi:MAG TPA: Mur ligase family protein [Solirubrobacterales bacterium]|nr:Mur ligase family protein [Solirubrobacterales bacterium]
MSAASPTSPAPDPLTAPQRRPPLPSGPFLVVGLGRAGFAAARALAQEAGPEAVRAWDGAADPVQLERAAALRDLGVEVRLGGDGLDALRGAKTVVKSPGVPPEAPVVAEATRRGLEVVDELDLGWRLVPAPTVAVTGTNGKSTVASLCVELLAAHGREPVLTGNTEYGPPLSEVALGAVPRSLVAEVSSYQAEGSPALAVDAAVFTNLTPEHLNRHRSMEAYGEAKRRLFLREDWCVPLAALNADDELGRRLAAEIDQRGGRALTYGTAAGAGYRIAECRWGLREAELTVEAPDGRVELRARLPGAHNAANLVAVLALADGLGLPREPTLAALAGAAPVPGRFEVLGDLEAPFDVVVDFAIAPDSVANVLRTARTAARARGGRLLTVLSVMGRSAPIIGRESGQLARELSDHLVLSAASYRGEPRIVALAALAAGARAGRGGTLEIAIDRREAIARALAAARPGDLVALLGRGPTVHEATDLRGGSHPLDEREIVRDLIRCAS